MRVTTLLISVLAAVIFSIALFGCSNSPEVRPAETAITERTRFPSDAEIIADITGDKDSTANYDEDVQELKHWKHAVQPVYSDSYYGPVISFQLVSEEDMDRIINRLTEGGYLSGHPENEHQFSMAIRNFQHDQGLPVTGQLDSATLKALLKDQDL